VQQLFHVAAESDCGVQVDPARLDEIRGDGWLWLDIVGYTTEELIAIGTKFDLDRFALEEVERVTKYPTLEGYSSNTFLIAHSIASDADRLRLVEYAAFVGSDFLVTFTGEDIPGLAWGREHILTERALAEAGPDRLLARIAHAGAMRFEPVILAVDERVAELEELAIIGHPSIPAEVQGLRRDLATLRQAVSPQRTVYHSLERDGLPEIGERAALRFGTVSDHFLRLTEEVESARSLLSGVLETYRSTVAEKANEVMKVLTVFSAIVLPMSLLAGIYGMNFENMPELGWKWAYFSLLALMATLGLGLWAYFARRGFVGGPRLSTIPRGLGRGIAGIANLTVVPTLRILGITPRDDG
jgi:magnesium transporter